MTFRVFWLDYEWQCLECDAVCLSALVNASDLHGVEFIVESITKPFCWPSKRNTAA